ncbi:hypothetical protein EVAR_48884_1 [Eumeta japonica]|uniref:Uncharacterized protein n=1 Tax=Eumeta variegata TaxID=151549 RepID=A0A4C1YSG5_EUMVA|nr:hypothetical protein EVAR_48884_1 [Eumeta japonica]
MGDVLAAGSCSLHFGVEQLCGLDVDLYDRLHSAHLVILFSAPFLTGRNQDSASTALEAVPNRSPLQPIHAGFMRRVYSAGDTSRTGWHSRGFAHVCGSGRASTFQPSVVCPPLQRFNDLCVGIDLQDIPYNDKCVIGHACEDDLLVPGFPHSIHPHPFHQPPPDGFDHLWSRWCGRDPGFLK